MKNETILVKLYKRSQNITKNICTACILILQILDFITINAQVLNSEKMVKNQR